MVKDVIKRAKAISLALVMAVGLISPITGKVVNANDDTISIIMGDPKAGYNFYDGYATSYTVPGEDAPSGVSYDSKSRTLTLNNCNQEKLVLDVAILKGDLTIDVKGENKLLLIDIEAVNEEDDAETYNIKFTGNGTLTVDPNKVSFNEDDDGFFMHHKLCMGSVYINGSSQNTYLSIDEDVNMNIIGYKWAESEGKIPTLSNMNTLAADKGKAIKIDGKVEGLEVNDNRQDIYERVYIDTAVEDSGILCKKHGYSKYCYYKINGVGKYTVYAIHDMKNNNCYTDSTVDWTVSASDFLADYDTYTSIPDDLEGKPYVHLDDEKVTIDVSLERHVDDLSYAYECTDKDGKKFAVRHNSDYEDKNGDETITPDEWTYTYTVYSLENDLIFYDAEMKQYYLAGVGAEETYLANPVYQREYTGEQDLHYEHLEGYTPTITETYYSYAIYQDPLVIKSVHPTVTATPTVEPTEEPTPEPTAEPTEEPTPEPTAAPADSGQGGAASAATPTPTAAPTEAPAVAVGTSETDKSTGATFTVTKSDGDNVEVEYKAPKKAKQKKVKIPSTYNVGGKTAKVTSIAANSFANNKTLTDVTIPSTVKIIKKGAFKKCPKLKKVTVPASVIKIEASAFQDCKGMKKGTFKGANVKTVGKNAFKGIPKTATFKVPKKAKKSYTKLFKKGGFKGKVK